MPERDKPQIWAAHIANLLLLGGMFAFSAIAYDALPARFPMHYALDGTPDRWVAKSWPAWLLLPGIAAAFTASLYGIGAGVAAWGRRHPRWINVPAKAVFLTLPPDDQAAILRASFSALAWIAVPMNGLLFYSQWIALQVARGAKAGLDMPFWLLTLLAVPAFAIVPVFGIRRRILDLAREREGAG